MKKYSTSLSICFYYILGVLLTTNDAVSDFAHGKCQSITIPQCQTIQYNATIFPNLMGHRSQAEAAEEIHRYVPLINVVCSPDLLLFLCSLYAPVCTMLDEAIPPCAGLCRSARSGCEYLMGRFNFPWDQSFNCDKFPEGGPQDLCVSRNSAPNIDFSSDALNGRVYDWRNTRRKTSLAPALRGFGGMNFVCPAQLAVPADLELGYHLQVGQQIVSNCGAPCRKMFFDSHQVDASHHWIGGWALACFLSCLFTLTTYILDRSRFPYPERPIIYIALSYFFIATVYIVGYFQNDDDIACNPPFQSTSLNLKTEKIIKQGFPHDWRCTLTAMVLYFFITSSSLWWTMLTICWFLSAGLKWGQEAIDAKSHWFHTFTWSLPSLKVLIILLTNKIEGDVLSGVCFVGLWNISTLVTFVLIPLIVYLSLGFFFLVLSFASLSKIRQIMKKDAKNKTDKLERLMFRIGSFSTAYIVCQCCVIGCGFYEWLNHNDWMLQWQDKLCRHSLLSITWQIPCPFEMGEGTKVSSANFYIFMLKYSALLMTGIFSGLWVWSGKTLITWSNFIQRFCSAKKSHNTPERHQHRGLL